ncbi:peptidoglycan-binding protein LysM [Flavobacterium sp. PL002]|uniref:peptidoglycan-binding protein LysM n=1 Tax=Flavobacterium sp. PL002 TaxID=1897058 RepID=UPI0017880FD6|nr:peptidoglycan-binding protein LysM [Flavobacterium sp. PL002]MBE0393780.1 hypothetical protein [Flavobacterium sp. PL002]
MYYTDKPEKPSYNTHRIYNIKKGDTLESVAFDLGIDARELRRYHNTYCIIADLIEADFKSHLETLILAPDKSERTNSVKKTLIKVNLNDDYTLPFLPSGLNNNYKVHYTTQVGDQLDTITLKINVKWLAVDKNKFHLFEINRDPSIYINGKAPDTMMEELAAKTAKVIYPLEIIVDATGKWIDIYNYEEIISRWENIKKEILDYYEGETIHRYIDHIDIGLESSNNLLKTLASDYFLRTFFSGLHLSYTANNSFRNTIYFPLEKNEESEFKVIQELSTYLDDSDFIKVNQKGEYEDTIFNVEFGFAPCIGNYNANYLLNSDTNCIDSVQLECSIEYDASVKVTITIDLEE